jgi:hypothetical protein
LRESGLKSALPVGCPAASSHFSSISTPNLVSSRS